MVTSSRFVCSATAVAVPEAVEVAVAVVAVWLIVWCWGSMPNTTSYGLLDVARCTVIFFL